jgi:hypothetical protein
VLREIELILAEKNEKIVTKVLGLRVWYEACSLSETSWCLARKMLWSESRNLYRNLPRFARMNWHRQTQIVARLIFTIIQVHHLLKSLSKTSRWGWEKADWHLRLYFLDSQSRVSLSLGSLDSVRFNWPIEHIRKGISNLSRSRCQISFHLPLLQAVRYIEVCSG